MSARSSRLPYVFAGVALLLVIGLAWANRDRFTPVTPGAPAPEFEARTLEGDTMGLQDFRGKVVLLNIWATWCPPCVEEMPSMQRLYEEYEDADFEVVAVSVDAQQGETDEFGNPGGDVAEFVESMGLTFRILHDPSGRIQQTYQTTGVPESFVIGRDGVIYKRVTGATEWDADQHRELIDRLLEDEAARSAGTFDLPPGT